VPESQLAVPATQIGAEDASIVVYALQLPRPEYDSWGCNGRSRSSCVRL
jgi:hypothetical protein